MELALAVVAPLPERHGVSISRQSSMNKKKLLLLKSFYFT